MKSGTYTPADLARAEARLRDLARECDEMRERKGAGLILKPALVEAEEAITEQRGLEGLMKLGNKFSEEMDRLEYLPDAVGYDTFQVPPLEGEDDGLEF